MQCDQIGRFWKFFPRNVLSQMAQIFGDFWDFLEYTTFKKNCHGYFLGNFCKILATF